MLLFVLLFIASALITAVVRTYLARRGILDHPNPRSSHTVPVPRGGGLGIIVVFLSAVAWGLYRNSIPTKLGWALMGGGLAIGVVGMIDDHLKLTPWPRLAVHSIAAAWALWCFDATRSAQISGTGSSELWAIRVAVLVGLVWLINLFNFMDGIDGIAGVEAVTVSGLGGFLLWRSGLPSLAQISWMVTASSLGFLLWNWAPAKIFMGDAGSGFLGFSLGVLVLFSSVPAPAHSWPWLILLAVFLVDATVTLVRRIFSHARWYEAHRSHAYQHAAIAWSSHAKVSLAVAAVNTGWLFPLAWLALKHPGTAWLVAAIAALPLLIAALLWKAGLEQPDSKLDLKNDIA